MKSVKVMAISILHHHLKRVLGWERFVFLPKLLLSLPGYAKRFAKADDDEGLRVFKQMFTMDGALYYELRKRFGEQLARDTTYAFLCDVANAVQRSWYFPPNGEPRSFAAFHRNHESRMKHGLIRYNEHDEIVENPHMYRFHITRCVFHETFRDMGLPWLTEAFCRSDEVVFNEYSPSIKFHRGMEEDKNTIARGGSRCVFVFERVKNPDQSVSAEVNHSSVHL
jgi:hypothetical protein